MKLTKRLKSYLFQLPIVGVGTIISGGFFMWIILQSNHPEDWVIYYFPLKIIAVVFAYILTNRIAPGGNVNYYFAQVHEPNEDEKMLNKLIAKYRNKTLCALLGIGYIFTDIIVGMSQYNMGSISWDGMFFYLFISFFVIAAMEGTKYFSAWINIQRVLRKDPSGDKLISSINNDPSLAWMDNPKPLINLPKIFKSFIDNLFGNKNK